MLKNKIFCFDENNPVFVEKIGYQIKFCAYVIYEWYLIAVVEIFLSDQFQQEQRLEARAM